MHHQNNAQYARHRWQRRRGRCQSMDLAAFVAQRRVQRQWTLVLQRAQVGRQPERLLSLRVVVDVAVRVGSRQHVDQWPAAVQI